MTAGEPDPRELERRVANLHATVRPLREALRLVVDDVDELLPKLRAVPEYSNHMKRLYGGG